MFAPDQQRLEALGMLVALQSRGVAEVIDASPHHVMQSRFFAGYMLGVARALHLAGIMPEAAGTTWFFTLLFGHEAGDAAAAASEAHERQDEQTMRGSDCGLADGLRYLEAVVHGRDADGWDAALKRAAADGAITVAASLI